MGSSSFWRMRVKEGAPVNENYYETAPEIGGMSKSSSGGEGVKKRSAGLSDEEACVDEDDDEDD